MGIAEVLTVIFVVLKLVGTISWSWWLVFLPEIIALVFYVVIFAAGYMNSYRVSRHVNSLFNRRE